MLTTRSRSRCGIALGLVVAAASIVSSGCSSRSGGGDQGEERVGRTSAAIVGGTSSDAARDFAVMLVFSDPATNRRGICTAALIAPRLVLTARHCVSETDLDVACGADGSATIGGAVPRTTTRGCSRSSQAEIARISIPHA
jgi:hypothetical protein